jgi:centromere protein J
MQNKKSILTSEQLQMYEILGINLSSFKEFNYNANEIAEENEFEENNEKISQSMELDYDEDDSEEEKNRSNSREYNNELISNRMEEKNKITVSKSEDLDQQQVVPKKAFLKRGAGLTNRFRIAPDAFNLNKLPRYKYQDRLQNTLQQKRGISTKQPPERKIETKSRDVSAKPTTNKKMESNDVIQNLDSEKKSTPLLNLKKPKVQIYETPKQSKVPKGSNWAQILSSHNIDDCSVKIGDLIDQRQDDEELDETSIFQLLEERLKNSETSPPNDIMQLIASLQKNLQPNNNNKDDTIVNPEEPACLHIKPRLEQLVKRIVIDESQEESDGESLSSNNNRVRFAENVEIHQSETRNEDDDDENSSILSSDMEAAAVELSQTSTPNERQKFDNFKLKMIGRQKQHEEMRENSGLLKQKLKEIEREKANIINLRSNLELERIQFEHEREDILERMKDEKIKLEIELHDERIKFDQQKQKLEKAMRDNKNQTSKKEREEIAKLKETIEELKEEMKNKETRHASTTARFRSQVKQLEKENQTLKLELEISTKDNKRFEMENARIKRDTNSKMLQQINKNIEKLVKPELPGVIKNTEVPLRRKSEPTNNKKRVQKQKEVILSSVSSDSEEENIQSKTLNTLKTRLSDPSLKTNLRSHSASDILSEMKREIVNADGSKEIWYPNGNLKKISGDGMLIRMLYYNKDIKETNINEGTVRYYYAENNTWHTTYIDGLEILEYPK